MNEKGRGWGYAVLLRRVWREEKEERIMQLKYDLQLVVEVK